MTKQRVKARVLVRWFRYEKKRFGPVEIGVLVPYKSYESEEAGDPIQIMLSVVEAVSRSKEGDYFEVRVASPGREDVMGETPRYKGARLLFPYPARLRRVGVLRVDSIREAGQEAEADYFRVKREHYDWYDVKKEVYVYEGHIEAEDDVVSIYLETDEGPRIVVAPNYERKLKDVLPRPQPSQESHHSGDGSGGDSSPSA